MSMSMSAEISIGLRCFEEVCISLGLPLPEHDSEHYLSRIKEGGFNKYDKQANAIYLHMERGGMITQQEHYFLACWAVIYQKRTQWLFDHNVDVQQDDPLPWEDLVFG